MTKPEHSRLSVSLLFFSLIIIGLSMLLIAGLHLDIKTQLVFSVFIFMMCLVLVQFKSEPAKYMLVCLTLLVSTRYIWWRATNTLAFTDPYSAMAGYLLFAAEIYAYVVLLLGYVQTIRPLGRKPTPLPEDVSQWPTVDVFIPTYNEPISVVAATMAGAMNMEYPRNKVNVFLLDDGNREAFKRYAAKAGVQYIARTENIGAKAGNLNGAFKHSKGELVAIFDCDQIPTRSFLQLTAGLFLKDMNLAQVQTPQYFYTPDPIEKNLAIEATVPNESSLFYGLIQDGNDLWNASYFCGSCAVLRRSAIDDIGGIAEDTVTEDAHTSLKLHRKGYGSAYLNEVQSAGLATESLSAHINQRIRWARGLAQIFRIDNPFFGGGLSLGQRLCYANATMHFLYAAPRLIFLIAPLFFLFFDLSIIQSEAVMVAAMALPHIALNNVTSAKLSGYWRHSFWAEIYETVLSFYIFIPTLMALIVPSKGKFNVTEKGNSTLSDYYAYSLAKPIICIGVLNAIAIGVGTVNLYIVGNTDRATTILNLFWASYNFIIIGAALGVAREVKQSRDAKRHILSIPCVLATPSGRRVKAVVENLSTSGGLIRINREYGVSEAFLTDSPFDRVSFDCGNGVQSFSVECVTRHTNQLRLKFVNLEFTQLRNLVRLLFSPADRWHDVREGFKEAGILSSLLRIIWIGVCGWWHTLTGFTLARRKSALKRSDMSVVSTSGYRSLNVAAVLILVCLSLVAILQPSVSRAQDTTSPMSYELRHLTDKTQKTVELGTVRYGMNIPFDIRRDSVVNSGELALTLSWNDTGKSSARFLQIRINEKVMWTATEPKGENVQLRLPFDGVLLSDYNTLSFSLYQDDVAACSITSSDSFEIIVHGDSRIDMDVTSIPIANDLDTLPLPFFDDRDPRRAVIQFVIPAEPSSKTLLSAGRAAAWFGALASYRGVEFRVTQDSLPTDNAIIVGIGSDLPEELAWLDAEEPRVLLVDNPKGSRHQLLVLTAKDDAGLSKAVDQLISLTSDERVNEYLSGGRIANYPGRTIPERWVDTSVPVSLGKLVEDKKSLTVIDNNFAPISIPFEVPGDFYTSDEKPFQLTLDYRYSPDFPEFDEYIYVAVNNVELQSINIREYERRFDLGWIFGEKIANGSFFGTLNINVPPELIRSSNSIEVRFTAPSAVMTHCDDTSGVEVSAGVGESSILDLTNGVLRGRYPDLSLFVNSGMPFTQYADLRETHIELPQDPEPFHYALFLNLMGRFAAMTGTEPSEVSVSRGQAPVDRENKIVIARKSDYVRINAALSLSPLSLSPTGLHYYVDNALHLYAALSDWVNPLLVKRQVSRLAVENDSHEIGHILSARSATQASGVLLIFIADTEVAGTALQLTLTDPTRIREVQGSAVVAGLERTESIRTGRHFTSGSFAIHMRLKWWLSENLIVVVLIVCVMAIAFAWSLPRALDRVALRRLQLPK